MILSELWHHYSVENDDRLGAKRPFSLREVPWQPKLQQDLKSRSRPNLLSYTR